MVSTHRPDSVYTFASPSMQVAAGVRTVRLVGRSPYEFFHEMTCRRFA